ncbi:efflux transporter periplasmic adaptor subunit [Leptolyngbya sp. 'hensonii']|uniref:efflux RND transporter periplasmic adaptor subunit n=1 Tax=Leptolyngbya sp. 'hensonii' TaxID=1922337 RepID=UPI00095033E7|nr:efflux RND transporter periplasmic adaptor subunit [Leptolyngbya sp. 'hensonii']OLP20304.1 efflux transporter periplasmic adaptor subunit [Leptolyngbya sp. 'hensonii']
MTPTVFGYRKTLSLTSGLILVGCLVPLHGCGNFSAADAETQRQAQRQGAASQDVASVNVTIARTGSVQASREYTGTTQPVRLVSLRSQVEGQLLDLLVTVGDPVTQGQRLAQVDSTVLQTNVAEAEAEVAALQSEVAQAQIGISDAQTQVNRVRAELLQARSDLSRLQYLFSQGAIAEQQVEQARTRVSTATETLRSAQEQVRTRQQAVVAAQGRVVAQQAVVAREAERQSFTTLTSPVNGFVVEQPVEPGNLVQPGTELLKLGDFSQVKVAVQVSELELGAIRLGQIVQIRLDALPQQKLTGRVSRISPAADPVARLVPIEVTLPNPSRRIGSGLLARVLLAQRPDRSRVVVPETALQVQEGRSSGQPQGDRSRQPATETASPDPSQGTLFVIQGSDREPRVTARQVTLGQRGNGQIEVISGLQVGERYVTRSSKTLKQGDLVRLSILSEQR